jgi:VWFA-related protein
MRLAVSLLVAAALGTGIGPSQDPKQPPIRTQANYVRVDIYPMSNGRPVQDLRAEDFEVLEDGVPQAIQNFEHIAISPGGPQAQRVDPTTVEASRQAIANPRTRVFVIFLDVNNVSVEGTWSVREPLIKLVDRILGPDDLVGIMTPEMSPAQIAFARRTDVFERAMRDRMPWGTRHTLHEDPREREYQACYPPLTQEVEQGMLTSELVVKMKARRRERLTLDALRDLSMYVRNLREERTAVIAVSEGWLLFRPDPQMTKLRVECACFGTGGDPKTCRGCEPVGKEQVPGIDPIGVGPGGRLGRGSLADSPHRALNSDCDRERMGLAQMDNDAYFRTLLDDANRANVSFYPVDPRGLAAWDTPLGPEPPPTMLQDQANLKSRREAMFNMAAATDGLAVMTSNDLDTGLKRVADDLTSYYLLGYYSTNAKLDGRFRKITVRVKRPGVDVRARRGYRAPTEAEVAAAAAAAPPPPVSAEETARTTAMDALARIRPEARFRIYAAAGGDAAGGAPSIVWVAGELQPPPAADPWTKGGTADIDVTAGGTTTTAKVTLAPGERAFLTSVTLPKPVAAGAFDVRARLTGADPEAARLADSIHVPLTAGSRQPLLYRRGPATGNRVLPAATFLFSRTERLRVEIPAPADAKPGSGRLLDRAGQPLSVPVVTGEKTDDAGRRWIVADVTLAPLGAGDYVIELSFTAGGRENKTVTAIRVGR